jgi:hypothetical protein
LKALKVPKEVEDHHVILNTMYHGKQREETPPFYLSLGVNGLHLNNCTLDFGDSINVIPLNFMKQLGLKTTHPYENVYGIDSKKVKVYGLIEYFEVYLQEFPQISLIVNIVVIDVPDAWGMFLSISWYANLGGFLCMDLTHAHIPMGDGTFDILYSRQVVEKHVMDLNHPDYHSECEFDVPLQIIEYDP